MGKIVIEKLSSSSERILQKRAAEHGHSVADEARDIVERSTTRFEPADNLYDAIRADIKPLGEFEFEPLLRDAMRDPPFVWDHLDFQEE